MFDENKSMMEYLAEAYNEAETKSMEQIKRMRTPYDVKQKEIQNAIFRDAEELMELKILNDSITEGYLEIGKKIDNKKEEIKKLYGIDASEFSIGLVKQVFERLNNELEVELNDKKDKYEGELKRILDETDSLIKEKTDSATENIEKLEEELEQARAEFERDFERERVEYDYNIKRERRAAREKRTAELRERKEALQTKEAEVKERRKEYHDKLEEIISMQSAVEGIEEKISSTRIQAAKDKETELNRIHKYEVELEKKAHENKIQALKNEYDHILQKYNALRDEISEISNRLDQCNSESRKLTGDTVRYVGGINILNSDANSKTEFSAKK